MNEPVNEALTKTVVQASEPRTVGVLTFTVCRMHTKHDITKLK